LIAVTILYGFAPLRALTQNWLLLFTAFLPGIVDHDLAEPCR
jgi:hypothetical protein